MNLFDELNFDEFTQIAIKQSMAKIKDTDIVDADIKVEAEKIIDGLTFTVPTLKKTEITSHLSLENSSGKVFTDHVDEIDNDVFATATYVVPFSGNAEIFKLKPQDHEYDSYPFILESDTLKFKIPTDSKSVDISEEWKENLVRKSFEIINSIESTLCKLEVSLKDFKNELIGPVIHSLKTKKEEALTAIDAARDINIFNSKNE